MAFSDVVSSMDNACLNAFGVAATFLPQVGGEVPLTGIFSPPAMMDDVLPGYGASNARFFVNFAALVPSPKNGDRFQINGDIFVLNDLDVDEVGGATLKLRKQ
jgi:hypothetical protein